MRHLKKFENKSAGILFGQQAKNSLNDERMSRTREVITIPKRRLRSIIHEWDEDEGEEETEFELVEDRITSSDDEDGGADHTVVIKRILDEKYFSFSYTDWDMNHNFDRDFPDRLREVFPRPITKIIYE